MNKKIKLPKDGLRETDDVRLHNNEPIGDDVEGHGLPTTAPPVGIHYRSPGHGGEAIPDEDDVKGPSIR